MEDEKKDIVNDDISLDTITAEAMIQPILYLQKAPNADTIKNIVNNNQGSLLHTSPFRCSAIINNSIAKAAIEDTEYVNTLGSIGANKLQYNQDDIMIEETVNYITQNTLIAFCNMIDSFGKNLRAIFDYIPIKNYVSEELTNEIITPSIRNFITGYIYYGVYDQFVKENIAFNPNGVFAFNAEMASQLEQIIFTKLCKACDKAISEVLLGTRVSPNLKFILDAGCNYYGIKYKGIETKNELYYRLNGDLVHILDLLMSAVIVPMCDNLIKFNIFGSFYYAFDMVSEEYSKNKKANNSNNTVIEDNDQMQF